MKQKFFKKMIVLILSVVMVASLFPVCVMAAGNSFQNATPISFDETVNGLFSKSNTVDYYKFTLPSSGVVTIKTQIVSIHSVDSYLYYGDDTTQSFHAFLYKDDDSQLGNRTDSFSLIAGTYYFMVKPGLSYYYGNYNFVVNFKSSNESFNGTDNSFADANTVNFNEKYVGFLAKNDSIDYYKFVLPLVTKVVIETTAYVESIKYYLYNGNEEKLDYEDADWDSILEKSNKKLTYNLTKGTYYFIVKQYSSFVGSYEFSINADVPMPTPTKKPTQTGWVKNGSDWYYYNSKGAKVTSWQQIGGVWYFFSSKGIMQTGWVQSGKNWYYMSSNGAMYKGWLQEGGKWYYMGASGAMAIGWVQDGGKWYYMCASGAMVTNGWVQSSGKWYYMSASGAMVTSGWVKSGNAWYYFNASGVMVTGELVIDGRKSKFSSSGVWLGYA